MSDALPDLAADLEPDLVVVSGDLTQRAKPHQFLEARRSLDRIEQPMLVVPGNHDVPLYRFWERFFSPYGAYKNHLAKDLEPVYADDDMLVVGVNSAHGLTFTEGRIGSSRLERLERQFTEAPAGRLKVAVIHHLLVAPPRFGKQKVLTNARRTVEVLARSGVELVLSGHYHQAFFASCESYYPAELFPASPASPASDTAAEVLVLASGTSTSNRGRGAERGKNSCFSIDFGRSKIAVRHLRWAPTEGRFRPHAEHLFHRPAGVTEAAGGDPV